MPAAEQLLDEAWRGLVAGAEPGGDRPRIELTAPISHVGLRSRFAVAETAVACVGLALVAAADLVESREGRRPAVAVDPRQVAAAVVSERHFRVADRRAGAGFAALSRFWPAADGWIRTHANYPWHRAALLATLDAPDDTDEVAAAIQGRSAADLEQEIVAGGGVAAMVRSAGEWAGHDQGRAVAAEPLIGHRWIPDGRPPRAGGDRSGGRGGPAEGIRILDLTRVIAGPVGTRYLGALGAEVLRIDPPHRPDATPGAPADSLLAKRSAGLDFTQAAAQDLLHRLLDHADVVVTGYRPRSLARFGLDADQLADAHPGLVIVQLAAWGHTGPWADRRGFDSIVQAPTGIARREAGDADRPGALPCQLLDHGTGYLAAAAALDGLRRQAAQGGTYVRTVSLARTAHWLVSRYVDDGAESAGDADRAGPEVDPWLVDLGGTPAVSAVGPPGVFDGHPLGWPGPPGLYRQEPATWRPH